VVAARLARHRQANLLFDNTGITCAKRFEGHTLADWKKITGINLWGVIYERS
jgi:NADP-dependent 3-hydroxy acid dehydrogenase YdfG